MKLVLTSDTHFKVDTAFIPDGEVFIHSGDLMLSGDITEWNLMLAWLKQLPHKIKIYVPGNHDFYVQEYPELARQDLQGIGFKMVGFPGKELYCMLPNGMTLLGLPFVTNLPNWAFNVSEEWLDDYLNTFEKCSIVVSHAPARNCLDYVPHAGNVGSIALKKYIQRTNPKYLIHGHIHEGYGMNDKTFPNTVVYNVAMCNEFYKQVNPPVVLELSDTI